MDSSDDMFAISDEEMLMPLQTAQSNPVEEYLLKQLTDVQSRIDNATSEIANMKETTARILNALQWRALYGENPSSDSDTDVSRICYSVQYLTLRYSERINLIQAVFCSFFITFGKMEQSRIGFYVAIF